MVNFSRTETMWKVHFTEITGVEPAAPGLSEAGFPAPSPADSAQTRSEAPEQPLILPDDLTRGRPGEPTDTLSHAGTGLWGGFRPLTGCPGIPGNPGNHGNPGLLLVLAGFFHLQLNPLVASLNAGALVA